MAGLLLMRGDDDSVRQAGDILGRRRPEELAEPKCEKRTANYTFARAVYLGLTGNKEEAREWLQDLQKHLPSYRKLPEALKALDD